MKKHQQKLKIKCKLCGKFCKPVQAEPIDLMASVNIEPLEPILVCKKCAKELKTNGNTTQAIR